MTFVILSDGLRRCGGRRNLELPQARLFARVAAVSCAAQASERLYSVESVAKSAAAISEAGFREDGALLHARATQREELADRLACAVHRQREPKEAD